MWTTESKKVELDFAITNTHTHAATQKVKLLSCKLCCSVVDSRLPLLHKWNVLICELQTFIGLNFNNILSGRHDETNSRTTTSWQDGWDTNMLIYRSFRKMAGKLMLHTEKISGNCCNMYCPSPQNPKCQFYSCFHILFMVQRQAVFLKIENIIPKA